MDGGSTKRFSQLEVNRYVSARVLEILSNVVSIIGEAGCAESISKGFVFAGGVTRTDHFYETLRRLSPEYRPASLRRDIYEDGCDSGLVEAFMTEIALAYQAKEPGVTFELRSLSSLMDEEPSKPFAEPAKVAEPEPTQQNPKEETYTYTTISQPQGLDEDYEDDFDEDDEPQPRKAKEPKSKGPSLLDRLTKGFSDFFGAESGDDY